MASMNKVLLLGHLGKDPELRHTQSNKAVCNFSLATTESYKDAQGNKQDRTEWHKIIVWDKTGETCAKYLRKGSAALVEGRIATRKYTNKENVEVYATEIVAENVQFLTPGNKGEHSASTPYDPFQGVTTHVGAPPAFPLNDVPVPFASKPLVPQSAMNIPF